MKTIYQTSFSIGTAERKPSLDEILKVIDDWSSRRTQAHLEFSKIKEEITINSGDASFNIIRLSRGDTSLVSLALKHNDSKEKDFKWETKINLRDQEKQPHKISIALSNGWSGTTLRPEAEYTVSRPSIVPMLIDAFDCYNLKQRLSTQPELLARENVMELVDKLYSKQRNLPIVLITLEQETNKPVLNVNQNEIAKSVVGLAHVYVCKNKFVPSEIEKKIGKNMSCYEGAIRIYWPIHRGEDPSFHPIITPEQLKEGTRAKYLNCELLKQLAKESISRVAEVSPEEIQEMRLRIKADFFTEQKDYKELADLYSAENDRLREESRQLKMGESKLQEQVRTLEAKILGLQSALNSSKERNREEKTTEAPFESVEDAVNRVKKKYSEDKLIILGRAQKGAKDCLYGHPETVFKALEWLATTYLNTRKGELQGDLAQSAMTQIELHYRPHQSKITMATFENEYYAEYDGKKIPLNEHLRKGTSKDPRHTLSIAFHYDQNKERVVVGFIGQHQTTKST